MAGFARDTQFDSAAVTKIARWVASIGKEHIGRLGALLSTTKTLVRAGRSKSTKLRSDCLRVERYANSARGIYSPLRWKAWGHGRVA